MPTTRSRSPKRAAPTFEILPPESAAEKTGWVYRSEPEPEPESATIFGIAAAVVVPPKRRPAAVEQPLTPTPPAPTRGWLETGFRLMTLPLTITFGMMRMPVDWMFGTRR